MAINRGKAFEKLIHEQLNQLSGVDVTRLYDTTNGYANIKNPCDFIVYKRPNMFKLEAKSTTGSSFSISRLTQLEKLLEAKHNGCRAGMLLWFIDKKVTFWVEADYIQEAVEQGKKSLSVNDLRGTYDPRVILIPGVYVRIYGVYDFKVLVDNDIQFFYDK